MLPYQWKEIQKKKRSAEIGGSYFMNTAEKISQRCCTGYHKEGEGGWRRVGTYIA